MSEIKKIVIDDQDIPKLRKHGFLRVGNFLIIVEKKFPIHQVKIFGELSYG